jgi:Tfp pilus assembly protein PilF
MYQEAGDLAGARACYRRVVELKPDYALAWFNLGTVAWASQNFFAARSSFERAVELDRANPHFRMWLEKSVAKAAAFPSAGDTSENPAQGR